jgi:hypothetical protein
MEKYVEHKEEAIKGIKLADHILTVSFPLVQDPKLLKFVLKNVHVAMENTIAMMLSYERTYKRIPPYNENFSGMLRYLKPVLSRYNLSPNYVNFLNEINEYIVDAKKSEVEFIRKEKFVFATKDYDLSTLSATQIKEFLSKAKLFMNQAIGVIEQNEQLNRKR